MKLCNVDNHYIKAGHVNKARQVSLSEVWHTKRPRNIDTRKKKKKNKCVNLLDNVDLALVPFYNSTGARVAYSLIENVR